MKIKNVIGYEGVYAVSEEGRVFNLKRGVEITPHDIGGYLCVKLRIDNKIKNYRVHRLVFEAFKGRIISNLVIDHIDGDKHNNHISNLRQISSRENTNIGILAARKNNLPIGVRYYKKNNKYGASISIENENFYLGIYDTPEEAHKVYLNAFRCWRDNKIKPTKRDKSVKLCKTCGITKPITEFYRIEGHGYSWMCKECSREYSRKRRMEK